MPKKPQLTLPQKLSENTSYSEDKKLILACSGGPDSMVLLDLFRSHILPSRGIIVAHVNHQLRITALRDEQIVRDYCEKNGILLEILTVDVKKESKKTKTTIEECARNIRKKWLEEIRVKHHADIIATAHHSDDQAETLLYRISK